MLGYFTDPYPDETLYSAVARYHYRAKYERIIHTMRDMFGVDEYKIQIDLPSHLDRLVERLPPGHNYSADKFIDKHTLLPFYAPFLPADRVQTIRKYMRDDSKGSSIYAIVGLLSFKIYLNGLKFCPLCAAEDRKAFGETYWHRPHQLPGVFVCGKHALFLNEVSPHPREIEDRNNYLVNAEQSIKLSEIVSLDLKNPEHIFHFKIAQNAEWMGKNTIENEDAFSFNARYRHALFNSRLSTIGGTVNLSTVKKKFAEKYSERFLETVSCAIANSKSTWIDRLFQSPKCSQHPVRHFLFIDFSGYSLEEFLQLPTKIEPFGSGPFPCLNPVADHFKKPVIDEVVIKTKQKSETEVVGTFYCQCGFVYSKYWQKGIKVSKFEHNRIIDYGTVWDNALIEMFEATGGDPDIEELGKKLGVVPRTLTRQIARLQLTDKYDSLMPKKLGKARMSFEDIEAKRVSYRNIWLQKRKENPDCSRSDLRKSIEPVFSWLYKHDPLWLSENFPEKKKGIFTHQYVDWIERDREASSKIASLAAELKALPGKPIFVSQSMLIKKLKLSNLIKRPDKIPLTIRELKTYGETYEEYTFRRIEWGIEECRKSGKRLSRAAFAEWVGITAKTSLNNSVISKKLDDAMNEIVW